MVLNEKYKIFVIYIITFNVDLNVYLFCQVQITLLDIQKGIIFFKYIKYTNVFLLDSTIEFFKYNGINNYSINLINNK